VIRKHPVVAGIAVVVLVFGLASGRPVLDAVVAALVTYVLLLIGVTMLFGLAQPIPEPPPPGELRKVRLTYRCSICGTEVRMTAANDEDPEPPRHCQEDMDLVAPID
jgi:hypothetical protein